MPSERPEGLAVSLRDCVALPDALFVMDPEPDESESQVLVVFAIQFNTDPGAPLFVMVTFPIGAFDESRARVGGVTVIAAMGSQRMVKFPGSEKSGRVREFVLDADDEQDPPGTPTQLQTPAAFATLPSNPRVNANKEAGMLGRPAAMVAPVSTPRKA